MPTPDPERRVDEAIAEYLQAEEAGSPPDRDAFLAAHPDLRDELASFLDARALLPRPPIDPEATLASESRPAAPLGVVRYFGDYELIDEIARGGMGVVYRARQVSLSRVVALKMILAGGLAGEREVLRFLTEAQAAANLDHPNVCPIHEVGQHHGQHYYSMKLIGGGNLAGQIARLVHAPREAASLLVKVARAVQHAHERGVLHRDLKPANVLLDEQGEPYVTDFGLARRVEGDSELTQTGAIVGTPAYMAPEQARAEKNLTPAVDVYALGAILYECLTGQPPFSGPSPLDVVMQAIDRQPTPPRQINARVPRDLETIALKCLEKEPGKRYATAAALADDLGRWLAGVPILARPTGAVERAWRWGTRNPVVAALSAAVLLLLVASSIGATIAAFRFNRLAGQEKAARGEAEQVTRRARWQLARQYVSRGWAELRRGDVLASLPWYVEALALEDDDPDRRQVHRLRLAQLLRYSPRMANVLVHDGQVAQARISDDGRYVLTLEVRGSKPHGRFWDAKTGRPVSGPWPVPGSGDIAFAPDGRRVAMAQGDRVEVREVPSGRLLATVKMPAGRLLATVNVPRMAFAVTWHPSGRSLLVRYSTSQGGGRDDIWESTIAARLFDAATGEPLAAEIKEEGRTVYWARFSPDGKVLATITGHDTGMYATVVSSGSRIDVEERTGANKTTTHLRDAATGAVLAELPGDDILRLEFSPDGRRFATGHVNGTARVWDLATRKPAITYEAGDRLTRLTWSGDGKGLLAAGPDVEPRWLEPFPHGRAYGAGGRRNVPDWPRAAGRQVLCLGETGIDIWHPLRGNRFTQQNAPGAIRCPVVPDFAQLGPDGRTLLTLRVYDRIVHLWEVGVRPLDRDTLGRVVTTPRYDVVYALENDRVVITLRDQHRDHEPVGEPLRFNCVTAFTRLSADGRLLTVYRERAAGEWEVRGYDVPSLKERFGPVALGRLRNGPHPVEDARTGRVALYCQPEKGPEEVRVFEGDRLLGTGEIGPNFDFRFSADGGTLAAVWEVGEGQAREASCRAWSLPDMTPRFEPRRLYRSHVGVGQISPDGRYLPVALNETKLGGSTGQVIDLRTGEDVGEAPPGFWPRAVDRAGERVLAGSTSGARLLDLRTWRPLTLPMGNLSLADGGEIGASPVLEGLDLEAQRSVGSPTPVAYDAETGESITVPQVIGVSFRWRYPPETRSVEQLRLLASVLSGRHLDAVGVVVPLEPAAYAEAWERFRAEMPEARGLSADEEEDWHRDQASLSESWFDWKTAETHRRWLTEKAPADNEARLKLGHALANLGRWADARREYEQASASLVNPFHARAFHAWCGIAAGDGARSRSDVATLLRDYENTGSLVRATELLRLTVMTGDAELVQRALATFRRRLPPRSGRELAWASLAEARAGRAKQAVAALREDSQWHVSDAQYQFLFARVLQLAGDAKEAAAALARADALPLSPADWRDEEIARLLREALAAK